MATDAETVVRRAYHAIEGSVMDVHLGDLAMFSGSFAADPPAAP